MQRFLRPALGALMLALVPVAALAQGTPAPAGAPAAAPPAATPAAPAAADADPADAPGRRLLAACKSDADTLCPGKQRGERRQCLEANAAKLSPACQTARADLEAKVKAMREACASDVKSLCAHAGKGKGGNGIAQCLRESREKLSAACVTAFDARYPRS